MTFPKDLMRRKSINSMMYSNTDLSSKKLKRNLTAYDLAMLGMSVSIGAGIFTVGAKAAATQAGPSVILSFVIAAAICALATLCYAELASTLPISGSSFSYAYTAIGEIFAWIVGWSLILELFSSAAFVSKYWGVYVSQAISQFGINFHFEANIGGLKVDWGPAVVIGVFTILLILGTKLSTRITSVITLLKVCIVLFVIIAGIPLIHPENWSPFIPPAQTTQSIQSVSPFSLLTGATSSVYGILGMFGAAATVFLSFIGFDTVASAAEETKNPAKTMPRGIFGGLAIVTVLYIAVTLVITGMVSYTKLASVTNPSLASAFNIAEGPNDWKASIIAIGAALGLTTAIMVLLLGIARITFALGRDGLIPKGLSRISKRFHTPAFAQAIVGISVALLAALVNVDFLANLINIGTLTAFTFVSISAIILRKKKEFVAKKDAFRIPFGSVIPILSCICCVWLISNLPLSTWIPFSIWIVIGLAIYFGYGYKHSELGKYLKTKVK
jgi:APA family basic amino acid/polyamine antiporter